MTAHAPLPPSGSAAWVHCPAWAQMNARFPQPDTDDSREGRAWHLLLYLALVDGRDLRELESASDDEGTEFSEEMIDTAIEGVELIRSIAGDAQLHCELRVYMPSIHPNNWGTLDLCFWLFENGRWVLYVIDFKYGHRFIDPERNWQLSDYACGFFHACQLPDHVVDETQVVLAVYQPRNYAPSGPLRRWRTTGRELRGMWAQLSDAAYKSEQYPMMEVPGAHCLDCPGAARCESLQQSAYNSVYVSRLSEPHALTAKQAGAELRLLQEAKATIESRLRGLTQEVTNFIEKGDVDTGFVLESRPGNLKWQDGVKLSDLERLTGAPLRKPESQFITPTQARAALRKAGLPENLFDSLTRRTSGSPELIPAKKSRAVRAFTKE